MKWRHGWIWWLLAAWAALMTWEGVFGRAPAGPGDPHGMRPGFTDWPA